MEADQAVRCCVQEKMHLLKLNFFIRLVGSNASRKVWIKKSLDDAGVIRLFKSERRKKKITSINAEELCLLMCVRNCLTNVILGCLHHQVLTNWTSYRYKSMVLVRQRLHLFDWVQKQRMLVQMLAVFTRMWEIFSQVTMRYNWNQHNNFAGFYQWVYLQ